MEQQWLGGVELAKIFESGYRNLKKNINTINDLNVFPVPDGDTGTNMAKTFGGGLKAVNEDIENVGKYMKKLSKAVLLSARGNSGVIFSQFIHGLYVGFADREIATVADLAYAFGCAQESAYKSIITPTEGTMLTVIRESADFLKEHCSEFADFKQCFSALLEQMRKTLAKTPDMLPVLKEANVVDSGGAGLVCIVEGMYAYLCGESIEDTPDFAETLAQTDTINTDFGPDSVLEYGYCTEFILQLMNAKIDIAGFDMDAFTEPLKSMGDSIVAVCSNDIVKIHIHTFTPEKVLEYGRKFGEFVTVKIENMSVQHSETISSSQPEQKEHLKYAIVAVASGEGIVDYFYSIGANVVIDGGQTNNPSVDAFISAFESLDAEHIIVLPNNSNIVLTAQQAGKMYTDTDIRVIPTKSVVEGYSALSMMNLWCDTVEELIDDMTVCLESITTGYVTTATRDTVMNGIDVKQGKYIGLDNKNILACGEDKVNTTLELVREVNKVTEKEVITIFCGTDVTEDEVNSLRTQLESEYPLVEVGFIDGRQEVYSFIISLE